MTLRSNKKISEFGLQILVKQKKEKRDAMGIIMGGWGRLVEGDNKCETWFKVMPGLKCRKCGSPIFEVVGPFIPFTTSGNLVFGCISCSTVSSAKTLRSRADIIKVIL